MFDAVDRTAEFVLLERIASALREEFRVGVAMDDQPGLHDPAAAGQVNRALRVTAGVIFHHENLRPDELTVLVLWVIMRLVQRRLLRYGIDERQIDFLLNQEPGRIDWLLFLLLTPREAIEHELNENRPENR